MIDTICAALALLCAQPSDAFRTSALNSTPVIEVTSSQDDPPGPIETDRPDFTETTTTVPFGRIQLEGGYTFTRMGSARQHDFGELLLRVATGRRTEARIGINSFVVTHGSGVGAGMEDLTLGLKVAVCPGAERFNLLRPGVAVIADTTLPTGSRAFGSSDLQPTVKLVLGWDLSETWSAGMNLNYSYASDAGKRFDQFSGSLTFGHSLSERVGVYFEMFGFFPSAAGGPDAHYLNAGVTYLVSPDFQLDLRVGKGISAGLRDEFIGIGAAKRW
jgi:hypothetical protein